MASALLRSVPGGYDIQALPIRIDPHPLEGTASWLRRAAHRYGLTPRQLLALFGITGQVTSAAALQRQLVAAAATIEQQIGVPAHALASLDAPTALDRLVGDYRRVYHDLTYEPRRWSRYCPDCLGADPPIWPRAWHNPFYLVCPEHALVLRDTCPACRQRPLNTLSWIGQDAPPWTCPSRLPVLRGPYGRPRRVTRPFCGHDLRTAPRRRADDQQLLAQLLLTELADRDATPMNVCGIWAPARVIGHAVLELLDAAASTDTDATADHLAAHLPTALQVLHQPDLDSGGRAVADQLSPTGAHAPIVAGADLAHRARNPVLAALQLHHHGPRLTPAAQLTFRCGAPLPRYPSPGPHEQDWPLLRLPEHGPHQAPLDPVHIPQVLWPGAVPSLPADSPIHAAIAALALARMGSIRPFGLIAFDLALPTRTATTVGATWRRLQRSGHWQAFLTELETLHRRLEQSPPPINYRDRRLLGEDTHLLAAALNHAANQLTLDTPDAAVRARFWELFTGGDITYAPDPLRAPVLAHDRRSYPRWIAARAELDRTHAGLFGAAHEAIHRNAAIPVHGPLTWQPP